jgi:hypothetical protein
MSDLLSAASLLLAVLAVLFGVWYPEITHALETPIPKHPPDGVQAYTNVRAVLYSRAVPLTACAFVLTLVFVPDAIRIVYAAIANFQSRGLAALSDYSAVSMAFCLVVCLALILAVYLAHFTRRLISLQKKLNPYRKEI